MENRKIFFKKNTANALVEVDEFFDKKRIRFGFRKYDAEAEKGHRITSSIDVFFTISDALILSNFILEGWATKLLEKKPSVIYKGNIGGYGKDENVRYRKLDIIPSTKGGFAICAAEGKGKRDPNGLIQPVEAPDTKIILPFSISELEYLGRILKEAALSYDMYNIKRARKDKRSAQFERFDSASSFIEISEAFNIGKIRIGFRQYDKENNNKMTNAIDIFLSIEEANGFINLVSTGVIEAARKDISNVNYPIWESGIGGYDSEGGVRYRKLALHAGRKADYALSANEGNGKRDAKRLIQPVSKADKKIFIPFSKRDLRKLSDALDRCVTAYHLCETMNWLMK